MTSARIHSKHVVAWDFPQRPSGTFYHILHDEFTNATSAGVFTLIQRSVAICGDAFTASRLVALAEHYGAHVVAYNVTPETLTPAELGEARQFIDRLLQQRLRRRGRRRNRPYLGTWFHLG